MNRDLFLAILAMDSCNRGYEPGITGFDSGPRSERIGEFQIVVNDLSDASLVSFGKIRSTARDQCGFRRRCYESAASESRRKVWFAKYGSARATICPRARGAVR